VAHRNAPLTELGRLRLAQCIVDQGWPQARAAERFQVSRPTAHRWAARYRALGPAGMTDRSSRPRHSPSQTPAPVVRQIVHLRWKQRLGPAQIAPRVGRAPSTVHRVLVRCRISQLAHVDRATGQTVRDPIHRYEHPIPGALLHADVKKLGNIPAGGGHRLLGRAAGERQADATPTPTTAAARSAATATRCTVTAISMPPSMTTPGLPTPRSTPTSRERPQPGSWSGPLPGSPLVASPSSGS
jgi:hypothetical protein